ncbi:MAG TPA: cytochrome b/b6 domain-containing protein [Casimicrobiaceae bacterium]|nr:cytochrome b/b6 domain-containing protein [Casimicrobiaceae bacterium]
MPRTPLDRYDTRTIVLHWTTALLVVVLWLSAQVIDWFPQGAPRTDMRSVHIALGVVLVVVLVYRIAWRRLMGARLPRLGHPHLARAAAIVHVALYVLLAIEIALGVTNEWVRGDSIFNLFTIPSFAPGDRALRRRINGYHELVANTILVVAGLHAAAGLVHHYVWNDGVLRRMWPVPWRRVG